MDTVSSIVGDRNAAAKMEIGALIYEDAGSVITADGCETLELYRRVFAGEDTAAGNWSLRRTSTAVSLDKSGTIDLQMRSFLDDDPVDIVSLDGGCFSGIASEAHRTQEPCPDSDVCIVLN